MDFLKQRLLGALFLLSLATAVIPAVFDGQNTVLLTPEYRDVTSHPYQVALNQQLSDSKNTPAGNAARAEALSYAVSEEGAEAWSIRVGSFSDPAIAKQLEQKLQQQGYAAYLQASDSDLYNVLVGPELAAANAHTVQRQLNEQLQLKGVVVPYEPILYVLGDVNQRG